MHTLKNDRKGHPENERMNKSTTWKIKEWKMRNMKKEENAHTGE